MSGRPQPEPHPPFKTKVALAAVKGERMLAEQYDVHPNLINQWRSRLLEGAADVFGTEPAPQCRRSTSRCCTPRSAAIRLTNDYS